MTVFRSLALACALIAGSVVEARAQEAPPTPPKSPVVEGANYAEQVRQRDLAAIVQLKVRVVLSTYQGEKKISSFPYDLTVRSDGGTSNIRMNTQVAVPSSVFTPGRPPASPAPPAGAPSAPNVPPVPPNPLRSFTYRDIGTNIDCRANNLDPGRFALSVIIEDTSIYKAPTPAGGPQTQGDDLPAFRTLRAQNSMVLRDGQSTEFTVASDKVTGEVLKAEVSISVSK